MNHVGEDHPLALELTSLRLAVATFQHEAHEASIKLQKYSLDSSQSFERTRELESENARLKEEIAVLRANPDDSAQVESFQKWQELILAHRRLSDKLSITEATLELRTTELTTVQSDLAKTRADADGAFELASRVRAREEEGLVRERALTHKARVAEEERRMADLVVSEYADLVRALEGRKSVLPPKPPPKERESASSPDAAATATSSSSANENGRNVPLVDSYAEGKRGLQTLLNEFSVESERLEARIAVLEQELVVLEIRGKAERDTAEKDRALLAKVQAELVKARIDDKAAARMVARYMEFSQSSTNALQTAISTLKTRHASTLTTLALESEHLRIALAASQRHTKSLKAALDGLSEDIARETYGRRREVSLRLALLLREAGVAEGLQRWSRKARELLYRAQQRGESDAAAFEKSVQGAEALLQTLNGDRAADGGEGGGAGAVGRILAAQSAVAGLSEELRVETGRRMELERDRAQGLFAVEKPFGGVVVAEPNGKTTTASAGGPVSSSCDTVSPKLDGTAHLINGNAPHTPSPAEKQATSAPEHGLTRPAFTKTHRFVPSVDVVHQPIPISLEEATFVYNRSRTPSESASPAPSTEITDVFTDAPASLATVASSPSPELHPQRHPLLADLDAAKHRYDDLQRAFRDCHLTLKDLQASIAAAAPATATIALLKTATQRLDDFNEDARVEVEIRIADEELTIRGYETLLAVPGAIADDAEHAAVKDRIGAFVGGTEKPVARAMEQLRRKLDDLQHDVASVKFALHALPEDVPPRPQTPQTPGWSSWTSILGGSPRPVSPAPPTFGTVMTTPRLRHTASLTQPHLPLPSPGSHKSSAPPDPYASLGLRIPMPSHTHAHTPSSPSLGLGLPSSRGGNGAARSRALSTMYTLGLGSRGSSLNMSANTTPTKGQSYMRVSYLGGEESGTDVESEVEVDDEPQTDVE